MAHISVALPTTPAVPVRDQFKPVKVGFLIAMHLGVIAVFWQTTWGAIGVCILLHALFGGLGICVGYHRLLTHRSFKCSKAVEYTLALLGAFTLEGGPIDWVAHHRQHHQYSDEPGDPHSARDGFFWSHVLWMFWTPNEKDFNDLTERYTPDLLRQPFYRFLGRYYLELSIALAALLYLLGGWPFVVWGMCVRLVITYHSTWLVNSASHKFGYRNFDVADLSTNCWWVALVTYGEGWHNNHHAFPTSARHGLRPLEFDLAYGFIRLLKSVGLAWDVRIPPAEKLKFESPRAA
jgi:stearoyl-CoA desaturase (delta-9 desaturase)